MPNEALLFQNQLLSMSGSNRGTYDQEVVRSFDY